MLRLKSLEQKKIRNRNVQRFHFLDRKILKLEVLTMKIRLTGLSVFTVLVMMVMLVSVTGCKKGGTGNASECVNLLPSDSIMVATFNVQKFAQLPLYDKMIKESETKKDATTPEKPEMFKDYQDFVNKTGIDPKKDITACALAAMGPLGAENTDMALVLLVNYNKDKIAALFKEKGSEAREESYQGVAVYVYKDGLKESAIALLNEKFLAGGTLNGVKKVVDVFKGKAKNVHESAVLKPFMSKLNSDALFSFASGIPDDMKKQLKGDPNNPMGNMFSVDLEKAEGTFGFVDVKDKTWSGVFEIISKDQQTNQKIAEFLNGLKGLAGMMGPEVMELAGKITIKATSESVRIEGSISEDLVDKVQAKMKEKMKTQPIPTTTENPEMTPTDMSTDESQSTETPETQPEENQEPPQVN